MSRFSFKRMLMFSRLQICETYFRDSMTTLRRSFIIVLVLSLLAMLFTGGDLKESIDFTESTILVLILIQSTLLYQDLISRRLLTPVSTMEKYISIYASSLGIGMAFMALAIILGSIIFSIYSLAVSPEEGGGLTLLYFREGYDASSLVAILLMMILFQWLMPFKHVVRKKKPVIFWSVIIGFAVLVFTPILLEEAGAIGEKAATITSVTTFSCMTVTFIIWGYRLLTLIELDSKDKDI